MPTHRILLADDDVDALRLVGLMLERKGYEIIAAASGNQAIQKAIETQPEIIILDVMMPDIDGYEVSTQLRKHPATEHIPILMFTAKNSVADKIAGFQAGVDDYLTKPIHPGELTSRVEALLHRTQRTIEQSPSIKTDVGRTIAFLPCKGGIGNTTLIINTALELKNMHSEARIVVAELQSGQGTLAMQMGISGAQGLSTLLAQPLSTLTKDLLKRSVSAHPSGIHLLCCTPKPSGFGPALSKEYVRTILRYLSEGYDFVLLDLPPTLTEPFIEALNLSDHILFSVTKSAFGIELAKEIIACLDLINAGIHKVNLILMNLSPVAGGISRTSVEQMFHREMISNVPYSPNLAQESEQKTIPMVLVDPNNVFTQQIRRIVQAITAE